jgi:hypothetical protein
VQVARASEYFRRWLLKWPDVQSLAGATLDEVHWAHTTALSASLEATPPVLSMAMLGMHFATELHVRCRCSTGFT